MEFAIAALNADNESFVTHIAVLIEPTTIPIHLFSQAQVTMITSEETGILTEYSKFSDVFSSNSAAELPKHTEINDHLINLLDNKQTLYGPIYSLGIVELENLKTYIKANLANSFIKPSKSPSGCLILFVRKNVGTLYLYVDYRGFNNP